MSAEQYVNNQGHLPEFLKDFHDQKDFFKAIYAQYSEGKAKKLLSEVNWIDAHCFTIDVFLWWMGVHGYKLQKARKRDVEFYDPIETIQHYLEERSL